MTTAETQYIEDRIRNLEQRHGLSRENVRNGNYMFSYGKRISRQGAGPNLLMDIGRFISLVEIQNRYGDTIESGIEHEFFESMMEQRHRNSSDRGHVSDSIKELVKVLDVMDGREVIAHRSKHGVIKSLCAAVASRMLSVSKTQSGLSDDSGKVVAING